MKKFFNLLKWFSLGIASLPWLFSAILGSISGSLLSAFMNGFKRGSVAIDKIALTVKQVDLQKETDKHE